MYEAYPQNDDGSLETVLFQSTDSFGWIDGDRIFLKDVGYQRFNIDFSNLTLINICDQFTNSKGEFDLPKELTLKIPVQDGQYLFDLAYLAVAKKDTTDVETDVPLYAVFYPEEIESGEETIDGSHSFWGWILSPEKIAV